MEMGDLKKKDNVKKAAAAAADDDHKLEDVAASGSAVSGSGSGSGQQHKLVATEVVLITCCILYFCYMIHGRLLAVVKAMAMDLLFHIFKAIAIVMAALLFLVLVLIGQKKYYPKRIPDDQSPITDAGEQKPIPDDHKPIKAGAGAAAGGAQKQQSTPHGIGFRDFRNLTIQIFFWMNYQRLFAIGKELFIALVMATIIAMVIFAVLMIILICVSGADNIKTEGQQLITVVPVPDDDDDNDQIHNEYQDQQIIGDDDDDNDQIHNEYQDQQIIGDDDEKKHDNEIHADQIQQVIGGIVEQKHDHPTPRVEIFSANAVPEMGQHWDCIFGTEDPFRYSYSSGRLRNFAGAISMELKDEKPHNTNKKKKKKKRHYKTEAILEAVHEGTTLILDILTGQVFFSLFNR